MGSSLDAGEQVDESRTTMDASQVRSQVQRWLW
ncbi:hypothetical protein H4W27_001272 [Nesterenkonia lutea]|uniref:Uncharacterized protein n=1 Tax=Nesterenkonia lutea TaxID=272919 RepID=A0ABR9JDZ8_9MICC|nr:hypothetical protein [Nesterenkonia lutea]